MSVARWGADAARISPAAVALCFEGRAYTYAALDALATRVAAGLRRSGVRAGDRVAIFLPNRPEFVVAYLAVARIGAIAVSLNPQLKRDEVRYMLTDCGVSAIFTDSERRAQVPDGDLPDLGEVILTDGEEGGRPMAAWLNEEATGPAPAPVGPDDDAVILYTSGTTGFPKGATLTHANLSFAAEAAARYALTTPEDRLLLVVPLSHCFGQNVILNQALLARATVVLVNGFDPEEVLTVIEREGVSMLFGVPTLYAILLARTSDPSRMRTVRYCHCGAAPLSEALATAWCERFGVPLHQGYGMTECSPLASYNWAPLERATSIGTPIWGVEMCVVDERGTELGTDEPGELLIRGPNVMKGYWNRPRESAEVLIGGWLHSGDIGRRDAEGNYYIMDRLKDMINVSGLKVYPAEVEQVLEGHPAVSEAAVFGVPDPIVGERVHARVVLRPECDAGPSALIFHCRERLAAYKVPERVDLAERLPRNAAGKLLRREIRSEGAQGSDRGRTQ